MAFWPRIHYPYTTDIELPGVLAEMKRVLKPGGYALFIVQEGRSRSRLLMNHWPRVKVFMKLLARGA